MTIIKIIIKIVTSKRTISARFKNHGNKNIDNNINKSSIVDDDDYNDNNNVNNK